MWLTFKVHFNTLKDTTSFFVCHQALMQTPATVVMQALSCNMASKLLSELQNVIRVKIEFNDFTALEGPHHHHRALQLE